MSLPGGSIWPKVNLTWRSDKNVNLTQSHLTRGEHLTRGQPDWSSNTLGHKVSLPLWGVIWPDVNLTKVVTHLANRCLCQAVPLTRGQPDQSTNTLGNKISLLGVHLTRDPINWSSNTWPQDVTARGVHLTKGQSDPEIWQKFQLALKPHVMGGLLLTRCQTDWSSNTWLQDVIVRVNLTNGQPDPKIWQKFQPDLTYGDPSDQRSAWSKDLTKMSMWPEASPMGVHLT